MERRNALFQIDPEEVEAKLRLVNAPLLDQAGFLLDQARATWFSGDSARMRRDAKRLGQLSKDIRQVRLSDTAPLRNAVSASKRVFGETENSLARACSALRRRIGDLELPASILLTHMSEGGGGSLRFPVEEAEAEITIEHFDRDTLPLEALRPYLSDHALKLALTKHQADHGPCLGPSVRYRAIARV